MQPDMCVSCGDGIIYIRVGAIIIRDGEVLMVGNESADYLYSVGGRITFGETAEEAVIREVFEETGVQMDVVRFAFVHENYFYGDAAIYKGKLLYEVSFYFLMRVPDYFEPISQSYSGDNNPETLFWIKPDTPKKIYPEFFRTEAWQLSPGMKHFVTDER